MRAEATDLLCFGYLAEAQVLHVDRYPPAGHGAAVTDRWGSVAGDAPIVALLATQHGLTSELVTNPVGDDTAGRQLLAWLRAENVRTNGLITEHARTPHLTVVSDDADTRTWFAWLEYAFAAIDDLDLGPAARARMVYLDCYRIIDEAAACAAAAVAALGVPMLLNLGGDPLSDSVAQAVDGARIAAVQTTVEDDDPERGEQIGDDLLATLAPQAAVVTLGRHGALGRTSGGLYHTPAGDQPVLHTHGAGAAFSAGYATAILDDADLPTALAAGCRAGTNHCARSPHPTIPPPSSAALDATTA